MKCRLAVVFIVLLAGFAFAEQNASKSALVVERGMKRSDFPQMKKLRDNIYIFSDLHSGGLGYLTNDMIVVTADGVLVADGQGTPEVTRQMVSEIAKVTSQPIKYVVVASDHGDHSGGNTAFPSGVTFISSVASKKTLEQQGKNARGGANRTVIPSETVADKRVLRLGTTEIQILNNGRAHTGGDLEVYLPRERVLFASEVFSNRIFPNLRSGYPTEWIATLNKVSHIDADLLIPGHGFVEAPTTMKQEFTEFSKAVTYVVAEATRLHNAGIPVEAAIKQANWGPYDSWASKDRNAPIAVQRVYDELDGRLK